MFAHHCFTYDFIKVVCFNQCKDVAFLYKITCFSTNKDIVEVGFEDSVSSSDIYLTQEYFEPVQRLQYINTGDT